MRTIIFSDFVGYRDAFKTLPSVKVFLFHAESLLIPLSLPTECWRSLWSLNESWSAASISMPFRERISCVLMTPVAKYLNYSVFELSIVLISDVAPLLCELHFRRAIINVGFGLVMCDVHWEWCRVSVVPLPHHSGLVLIGAPLPKDSHSLCRLLTAVSADKKYTSNHPHINQNVSSRWSRDGSKT